MNKVLVVDDEEDILNLVKTILVGNGYEVFTAKSGEEALTSAVRHQPDIIILDIVMPGISGLEVCRLLKNRKDLEQTPIVVLSALDREIDKKYIEEAGADEYINKPFDISELLKVVDRVQNSGN